jgi:hypothetical protein
MNTERCSKNMACNWRRSISFEAKDNSYRVGLVTYTNPPVETEGYLQATLTALF